MAGTYFQNVVPALRENIARVWPDVVQNGVWEASQARLIPWTDYAQLLPFAVVLVNGVTSGAWGLGNVADIFQVDIFRVQRVTGPSGGLPDQLTAHRDDLITRQLVLSGAYVGQMLPEPYRLAWDDGMSPNDLFADKLQPVRAGRLSDTLRDAQALAVQYSSGTLTEQDLIQRDHPYALRHGSPLEDPTVINSRTGKFRASWRITGPFAAGGVLTAMLENTDPKAAGLKQGLVNGRRLMFTRDIDDRVAAETWPRFEQRCADALIRAWK